MNPVEPVQPLNSSQRIAVVAIHGVGDHQPFETAKFIGDMLANLKQGSAGPSQYTPFRETVQRLNIRPVRVYDPTQPQQARPHVTEIAKQTQASSPMDAIAQASYSKTFIPDTATANVTTSLDHVFMETQLQQYKGERPEDTYELLRLEGKRLPSATAPEKLVHIYDMFWGDLSQLSTGFTQIFGELYQLLLHLGSLGANTVKAAAIHFQKGPDGQPGPGADAWKGFDRAQSQAAAMLGGPIPVTNLYIAALVPAILVASMMRTHLGARGEFIAAVVLVSLLFIGALGYLLMRRARFSFALYSAAIFAVLTPGVGAILLNSAPDREWTEVFCAAIVTALAFGAVALIIRAYDRRRPGSVKGARIVAGFLIGAIALASPWLTVWRADRYYALVACFNIVEVAFFLVWAAWTLFLFLNAWAFIAGWAAVRAVNPKRSPQPEALGPDAALHYDRAVRTWWTARLLLALPPMAFTILTLMAWTGLIKVGVPLLPCEGSAKSAESKCPPVEYVSLWRRFRRGAHLKPEPVRHWIYRTLDQAGVGLLLLVFGAVLLALLITAWSLFPAVWDEVSPPRTGKPDDLERQSYALGTWLNFGFRYLHLAGQILYWAVFLFVLSWTVHDPSLSHKLTKVLGGLVAGAAVSLFGLGARFNKLALGFRPAVRVMLDVDNWLREHPRDFNPRARICGRYVSLLRHIVAWRSPEGDPYQALVIIAHSQGTVITADLLRFLYVEAAHANGGMAEYDPELDGLYSPKLPVYLFTMGCPLRQLYGLRFPYLYGWARHGDRDRASEYKPLDIPAGTVPDPASLGVELWVNAFRSADYIGRHLWRSDSSHYNWSPLLQPENDSTWDPPTGRPKFISSDAEHKRIEFCIGPGAHTHYWDSTAKPIAEMLDRLIGMA